VVDDLDRPGEECGVAGVFSMRDSDIDVARTIFFALYAVQHRGQESAGIATSDGTGATIHRGMGLVSQVFNEDNLGPLTGHVGLGHNRYSTTGHSNLRNIQPFLIETLHGPLAVAHNGNLTNAWMLRRDLLRRGVGLSSSSDSEVLTQMLAMPHEGTNEAHSADWEGRLKDFMKKAQGAYSLAVMTPDALYAARDPNGLRPLCFGELLDDDGAVVGWLVASESPALQTVGARFVREVAPGEIIRFDKDGVHSSVASDLPRKSFCIFEYVYFARPDAIMEGQTAHAVRQRMGRILAGESPADADVVIGVPDSSLPAAIGFADALGLPYTEGLIKNRYIGRTFIQPSERLRRQRVKLKYNVLRENLEGKRVVVVDDSIVRGTTMGPLVKLIREGGGASEVHVRVSSPPVAHPCFMGVDLAEPRDLIAHRMTVDEIRDHVGADSLAYLSQPGLLRAVAEGNPPEGHCDACFSGRYPIDVSHAIESSADVKLQFGATIRDAMP
jgi:amidophosphoribosyltransferase